VTDDLTEAMIGNLESTYDFHSIVTISDRDYSDDSESDKFSNAVAQDPQAVAVAPVVLSNAVDSYADVISPDPFADSIAPRISLDIPQYVILGFTLPLLLIDTYRPEFAHNYHQGPESNSHGLIFMPLPSFDDAIAAMPSLKNGNTGNLIQTKSVFTFIMSFCFVSLIYFLSVAKDSLFFLVRPSHSSIYLRPIFKNVRVTSGRFLLSSILLPNRRLPMETPTLQAGWNIILRMGLSIMFTHRTK
jgi:hypothetical protein